MQADASTKARAKKTYDLPMRVRRRQSDARWRANVASCFETLKHVIPVNKRAGKRQISKALILQETAKHITFLEGTLATLLQEKGHLDGIKNVEGTSKQSMQAIMDQFIEKQRSKMEALSLEKRYKRNKFKVLLPEHVAYSSNDCSVNPVLVKSVLAKVSKAKKVDPAPQPDGKVGDVKSVPGSASSIQLKDGSRIKVRNISGNPIRRGSMPVIGRVIVIAPNRECGARQGSTSIRSKIFGTENEGDGTADVPSWNSVTEDIPLQSYSSPPLTPCQVPCTPKRKGSQSSLGSPQRKRLHSPRGVPHPPAPTSPPLLSPAGVAALGQSPLFPGLLTPTKTEDGMNDYTPLKQKEEPQPSSSCFTPVRLPPNWACITPTKSAGYLSSHDGWTSDTDWDNQSLRCDEDMSGDEEQGRVHRRRKRAPSAKAAYMKCKRRGKGNRKRQDSGISVEMSPESSGGRCYTKTRRSLDMSSLGAEVEQVPGGQSWEDTASMLTVAEGTDTEQDSQSTGSGTQDFDRYLAEFSQQQGPYLDGEEAAVPQHIDALWEELMDDHGNKLGFHGNPTKLNPPEKWGEDFCDIVVEPINVSNKSTKLAGLPPISCEDSFEDILINLKATDDTLPSSSSSSDDSLITVEQKVPTTCTDTCSLNSPPELVIDEQVCPIVAGTTSTTCGGTWSAEGYHQQILHSPVLRGVFSQEVPASPAFAGSCKLDLQLDLKSLVSPEEAEGLQVLMEGSQDDQLTLAHWSQAKPGPWVTLGSEELLMPEPDIYL